MIGDAFEGLSGMSAIHPTEPIDGYYERQVWGMSCHRDWFFARASAYRLKQV
jgi:hypothetical protein